MQMSPLRMYIFGAERVSGKKEHVRLSLQTYCPVEFPTPNRLPSSGDTPSLAPLAPKPRYQTMIQGNPGAAAGRTVLG